MEKIKLFFVVAWQFIKKIVQIVWRFCLQVAGLIKKIRNGEALELHPLVGIWANRLFKGIFVLTLLIFAFGTAVGIAIYKYKINDVVTRVTARVIPYPATIVQGRIVTMDSYYRNYQYITKFYSSTQQTGVDYGTVKQQIMDQLVDNEVMKSQAKKYGVTVTSSDITNAYSDVVTQNGGEDEVKKVLNDLYGLNVADFKQLIADQILQQKLQDAVPVQVRASHILIRVDQGATDKQVADAKTKIDKVAADLKSGADFVAEAKQYSEDTGSATNGGDLGFFSHGQMDPDFEKIAFTTSVGALSEPFKTQFGWHLVKVLEKKGQVDTSFADWLTSLRKDSLILKMLKV
ncbi:MAG: peptidylprolyl isomerase [Candidatus Berkelbacteria bacterium]|nr:peptidylprolyl isomerase [Candidatus Berkelbacteria bacterium]